MTPRRAALAVGLVAVLVGSSLSPAAAAATQDGGETMDVTVTVTEDGELETIELVWKLDAQTYSALHHVATEEGYDSVAAWYAEEQLLPATNGYEDYGAAADREGDVGYAIEIEFTEFDLESLDDTDVSADGERVTVELGNVTEPAGDGTLGGLTYVVEMPGEITAANADSVDGTAATWVINEDSPDVLTAESGTEGSSSDADDSVPGFGVVAAVAGALVASVVLSRSVTERI